jgi:hypothetical protein
MDRLARELGLRGDDARVRALGAQRSAAWWIAQRDASLSTLLSRATLLGDAPAARAAHAAGVASAAAPASHPRVGLCVLARDDGAVPRAAEAILRAHAPPAIDVFRAAPGRARGPEPVVDEALRERGLEPPGEPRSLVDAARAVAIVSVGEPPRLGEDFRGKRFHLWSTTPERPETLAEARDVFGQLTHQARCLVAEYRARLHPRT